MKYHRYRVSVQTLPDCGPPRYSASTPFPSLSPHHQAVASPQTFDDNQVAEDKDCCGPKEASSLKAKISPTSFEQVKKQPRRTMGSQPNATSSRGVVCSGWACQLACVAGAVWRSMSTGHELIGLIETGVLVVPSDRMGGHDSPVLCTCRGL